MSKLSSDKSINIAIIAMGGQGGGVLSKWVLDLAEANGYMAQYTSVPGVAQRTGSTIYYIELFPADSVKEKDKEPVLALTPIPGDVDIVIASEMIEAGRALLRQFVTPQTVFIASDHRDYTIFEKQEMGDGRRPVEDIQALSAKSAKQFICFDMDDAARSVGSVISSVLFGALAGSGALPFSKGDFETTIKDTRKAVEANLRGFQLGYAHATGSPVLITEEEKPAQKDQKISPQVAKLIDRMNSEFPTKAHFFITEGLKKILDHQGFKYADLYLDRLSQIKQQDDETNDWLLTAEMARYLALAMAYDDVIRVADIKTRSGRFAKFRDTVKAEEGQVVNVSEYMHPRLQEICEIMPAGIGKFVLNNRLINKIFGRFFSRGRRITTTKLGGFILLYLLGRQSWMRPFSMRMKQENDRIELWMTEVSKLANSNYDAALEFAGLQRLIKGYGDTHHRGLHNYGLIYQAYETFKDQADCAEQLKRLKEAALKDENGVALAEALSVSGEAA